MSWPGISDQYSCVYSVCKSSGWQFEHNTVSIKSFTVGLHVSSSVVLHNTEISYGTDKLSWLSGEDRKSCSSLGISLPCIVDRLCLLIPSSRLPKQRPPKGRGLRQTGRRHHNHNMFLFVYSLIVHATVLFWVSVSVCAQAGGGRKAESLDWMPRSAMTSVLHNCLRSGCY